MAPSRLAETAAEVIDRQNEMVPAMSAARDENLGEFLRFAAGG